MSVQDLDTWIEYGNKSDEEKSTDESSSEDEQKTEQKTEKKPVTLNIMKLRELTNVGMGWGIKTQIFYKKGATKDHRLNTLNVVRNLSKQLFEEGKIGDTIVKKGQEFKMRENMKEGEEKENATNITFKTILKKPRLQSPNNKPAVGTKGGQCVPMTKAVVTVVLYLFQTCILIYSLIL